MGPKKWHMNLAVIQDTQYSKVKNDLNSYLATNTTFIVPSRHVT